jgi:hypothetical protein
VHWLHDSSARPYWSLAARPLKARFPRRYIERLRERDAGRGTRRASPRRGLRAHPQGRSRSATGCSTANGGLSREPHGARRDHAGCRCSSGDRRARASDPQRCQCRSGAATVATADADQRRAPLLNFRRGRRIVERRTAPQCRA